MSKKTVEQIINSGNDYVIAVKANQPNLYKQIEKNTEESLPISTYNSFEKVRDRSTKRFISVFDNLEDISPDWVGLKRIIRVERLGKRADKPYSETMYYISSMNFEAYDFALGIRGHWGIENRLHWVKDVVFNEDRAQMIDGYAATNFSIIRSFVINLFRRNGFNSMTKAIRHCAHNILLIFSFLE
ncbi:MAG: ISAs1 family transposase [Cyanobacteria bacterium J06639_18]